MPEPVRGERLDRTLTALLGDRSRARVQALIKAGQVTLAGTVCRQPRQPVYGGDELTVVLPAAATAHAAEALPLSVAHEDDDVVVIDKPAGLVVHPGAGNPGGTLLNALLAHFPELAALPRVGIVHRLDKDTSGLLVVARTERAHRHLTAALAAREVHRGYLAVVRGRPTGGGNVDAPIGRHPRQRVRMAVVTGGRAARTDYRVERRFGHHAALDVRLHSGRTHQIRVHLAHIGHALVGDPLYGGRPRLPGTLDGALREYLQAFPRQALHARRLEFVHPASAEPLGVTSPLPADLDELLARLTAEDIDAHA